MNHSEASHSRTPPLLLSFPSFLVNKAESRVAISESDWRLRCQDLPVVSGSDRTRGAEEDEELLPPVEMEDPHHAILPI
ncbi:hypothetical protein ECG_00343 [Echinococcus granulosus]|nr:hypothetical protein ECG_00343 [Echinococcus granulosus]